MLLAVGRSISAIYGRAYVCVCVCACVCVLVEVKAVRRPFFVHLSSFSFGHCQGARRCV